METADGDALKAELGVQSGSGAGELEQRIRDAAPYEDSKKTKPLSPSELPKTGALERVRAAINSFINRKLGPPTDPNDPQAILAQHERRSSDAYYNRVNRQVLEDKRKHHEL